jgi:hypothetical protein
MPEANLFYLPADFDRADLYLGFTLGLAYRHSNAEPLPPAVEEELRENSGPTGLETNEMSPAHELRPESQPRSQPRDGLDADTQVAPYPDDDPYP